MMWLRLIANWRDASRGWFARSPSASDQLRRAKAFEAEISFTAKATSESSGRGCENRGIFEPKTLYEQLIQNNYKF